MVFTGKDCLLKLSNLEHSLNKLRYQAEIGFCVAFDMPACAFIANPLSYCKKPAKPMTTTAPKCLIVVFKLANHFVLFFLAANAWIVL